MLVLPSMLMLFLLLFCTSRLLHSAPVQGAVTISPWGPIHLTAQVITLDSQTAKVSWTLNLVERNQAVEIVYSPTQASYFIVQPVLNPVSQFHILENLIPLTEYQVVVRTINSTLDIDMFKQSSTLYFNTGIVLERNYPVQQGTALNLVEVVLVILMLLLWVVVIRIFLQRWDKLSRLLPYQPVYSKEMAEKIEMEEEKLRSGNSFDICPSEYNVGGKHPLLGCISQSSWYPLESLDRAKTNSTFLLKQPNSIEVDRSELRKTQSAENVFTAPTIVIDKIYQHTNLSAVITDQQTPHLLSTSPPTITTPNPAAAETGNLLRTPSPNFFQAKFPSNRSMFQTSKVYDGRSLDLHNYRGTLFINGRSLDANYYKGSISPVSTDLDCPPRGYRRLSDVPSGQTAITYRQKYRGRIRLGNRQGLSPCLSYQARSCSQQRERGTGRGHRLVKQKGVTGSGDYNE